MTDDFWGNVFVQGDVFADVTWTETRIHDLGLLFGACGTILKACMLRELVNAAIRARENNGRVSSAIGLVQTICRDTQTSNGVRSLTVMILWSNRTEGKIDVVLA